MRTGRALAALALLLAIPIQASCAGLLGIDNEGLVSAVGDLCQCPALQKIDGCAGTLGGRLDMASDDALAAWLQTYHARCEQTCDEVLTCLGAVPTCSVGSCSINEECCQVDGPGTRKCDKDTGKCEPR